MKKVKYILILVLFASFIVADNLEAKEAKSIICNYNTISYKYEDDNGWNGLLTMEVLKGKKCTADTACGISGGPKVKDFKSDDSLVCPNLCCTGTFSTTGKQSVKITVLKEGETCASNACPYQNSEIKYANDTVTGDNNGATSGIMFPAINFGDRGEACEEFLGPNLVKLIKTARIAIQIVSVIITIVFGMMLFVPPIISKDSGALSKAFSKFVTVLIVLAIILVVPTIVKVIGLIAGFDITCI